jgi:putative tryptophan/tyrosine transport system substrate-binding protein
VPTGAEDIAGPTACPTLSRLTDLCHRRLIFTVVHNAALTQHDVVGCSLGPEVEQMRRREFITLLGGAAAAWPLAAGAQQADKLPTKPKTPVIGFLHSGSPEQNVERLAAYRRGLSEAGFVEGQNVVIEYRWAAGQNDKLPAMAADLIRQRVDVIATPGSTDAALAAKSVTATIPIVFAAGSDVIALGLVASLNRPGGNVTGVTSLNTEVVAKRLGIVRELAPQASSYFALVNPSSVLAEPFMRDLEAGAASLGIHIEILRASTAAEIDSAFAQLPQRPDTVMLVSTDAFFFSRRAEIVALVARRPLPAMYDNREYPWPAGSRAMERISSTS